MTDTTQPSEELRQHLETKPKGASWGKTLLELAEKVFEQSPDSYAHAWASLLEQQSSLWPAPLLTVTSLEELERVGSLLPGVRLELNIENKPYNGRRGLSQEDVEALARSPQLARVITLKLGWNLIGDEGAATLASSPHIANVTKLHLECNDLKAKGAEALASSPHLAQVKTLNLKFNDIDDQGLDALAGSPHLTNVTALNLEENQITMDGLDALSKAPSHLRATLGPFR